MNKYSVYGGILIAILIAIGAYFHTGTTIVKTLGTAVTCGGSTTCLNGDLAVTGALAFGGQSPSTSIQLQGARQGFAAAGMVACAVQNPFSATSSIAHLFYTANATSSAQTLAIGTTTSATATSTSMLTTAIAANSNAVATWSPSSNNDLIAPNAWVTFGYAATNIPPPGSFDTGSCGVTFINDN